ncbi:MAG: hypothetical protein ACJA1Z_001991 [Patiriisocius sp.]|jgi:hypothetical protein
MQNVGLEQLGVLVVLENVAVQPVSILKPIMQVVLVLFVQW